MNYVEEKYCYMDVLRVFERWLEDGKIQHVGRRSGNVIDSLDVRIFKFFGYNYDDVKDMGFHDFYNFINRLDNDPRWLFSPHAFTIFKAKVAQGAPW